MKSAGSIGLLLMVNALLISPATLFAADAPSNAPLPFVSSIFGDHMVLQRGVPNTFWGWSKPGDSITVTIGDHTATATADAGGRWETKIDPPAVGGPYEATVSGARNVQLHDVLVGDVWLCGGQSNMELGLTHVDNATQEVQAADRPQIRLYTVHSHVSYSSALTPQGHWKVCSPKTVTQEGWGGFSAVGYFFGSKLNETLHVPIGLVEDCVGGTAVETWMSRQTLESLGGFDREFAEMDGLRKSGAPEYGNYIMHWYDQYDIGLKGSTWAATDFDDSSWKTVHVPGGFAELGVADTPSVCWFRKEVTLPDPLPAIPGSVCLGVIERMDTVWVNGHWIGASAWVENPRYWAIPAGVLKPGRNVVTVRVFKVEPKGGFESKPEMLKLMFGDQVNILLAGEWKGAVSVDARPPHPMPLGFENWPTMPSVLYQGMIEPVAPLALKGAIWYQGEANADRASQYKTLLTDMIGDWRHLFGQGDFPVYIVSLPAFMQRRDQPGGDGWTELREAQIQTAASMANCGVAITVDTGEADNIHPKEKRIVGERLALCALAQTYGQKVIYQGPTMSSVERMPGALRIQFDHTDGGLVVKGDALKEFSVAGADHHWQWAEAKVDGDTVVVSSPEVPDPQDVRYAWQSNPVATLYNGAGLPAVPFRTDH
jgi:sialate O-acetylesterase